jgi:hypothetical protein
MCQGEVEKLSNSSEHCQVQKVASLLAQALSLRFKHEEFCDGEKPIAKLSLSPFSSAQALLLRAG